MPLRLAMNPTPQASLSLRSMIGPVGISSPGYVISKPRSSAFLFIGRALIKMDDLGTLFPQAIKGNDLPPNLKWFMEGAFMLILDLGTLEYERASILPPCLNV